MFIFRVGIFGSGAGSNLRGLEPTLFFCYAPEPKFQNLTYITKKIEMKIIQIFKSINKHKKEALL